MRVVAIILATALIATPVWAHSLKMATWNIEHLRDTNGEGPNPRDQADFDRLKGYAEVLDAFTPRRWGASAVAAITVDSIGHGR